jgi:hypothetical protein
MKTLFLFLSVMFPCLTFSQVLNGSFENGSLPDLSHWEWTCGADTASDAPPGGGNWCINVQAGNTQSCNPGYAYQKFTYINSIPSFILSAWAYAQSSPEVGIYFGRMNNGTITLQAGTLTSSTSWTHLSVLSNFVLSTGDAAVVVLFGGLTGGPIQGSGYFDLVSLQVVTAVDANQQIHSLHIAPNPFSTETTIYADHILKNATLTLFNSLGQAIKQIKNISGQTIMLSRDNLPAGLYNLSLTEDNIIISADKLLVAD